MSQLLFESILNQLKTRNVEVLHLVKTLKTNIRHDGKITVMAASEQADILLDDNEEEDMV